MSEYDVISNFRTEFRPLVPSNMRIFCFSTNYAQISHRDSKLDTNSYFWLMIKKCFMDDFGQYDTKIIILRPLFDQMTLRKSIVMATPKDPGEQKLFERVCYMLKLKVTKFQFATPNDF